MMRSERNPTSTQSLRVPPPTVAITRRESILFPVELGDSSTGIVGYSKTTEGDNVTIRCIWSGRLTDLSFDRERVEREVLDSGYDDGARIGDSSIYIDRARLVDSDGTSVAPMFIPRWSVDLRMSGETLLSIGASKAIRLAVPDRPASVPTRLLDRVNASYQGRAPWTVTASSLLTLNEVDSARIARSDNPVLQLDLLVRAIAVPEL